MNQKQQDKTKAQQMLETYLPNNGTMYGVVVGATDGANGRSFKRVFTVVDIVDSRIVNINLYIANFLGMRRDKWGNVSSRMTPHEIAEAIGTKLGRKINVYGL